MSNKILPWIVLNGGLLASLIFGFTFGVEGAKNIGLFIVWLSFFLSMVLTLRVSLER